MMRTLIVTAALAALVTTAASATATAQNPKPGEYAQHSAVYAEILRACQRSYDRHFSSDNVRALKLEDDAARYAEKLHKDNPAQFKLQIEGCKMSLPRPKPAVVLARTVEKNGYRQQGRLSEVELKNLEGLAQKALGPVPADARDYTTHVTRRMGAPAPGCVKGPDARPGRGTLVRWRCPPGTIKRLGW